MKTQNNNNRQSIQDKMNGNENTLHIGVTIVSMRVVYVDASGFAMRITPLLVSVVSNKWPSVSSCNSILMRR